MAFLGPLLGGIATVAAEAGPAIASGAATIAEAAPTVAEGAAAVGEFAGEGTALANASSTVGNVASKINQGAALAANAQGTFDAAKNFVAGNKRPRVDQPNLRNALTDGSAEANTDEWSAVSLRTAEPGDMPNARGSAADNAQRRGYFRRRRHIEGGAARDPTDEERQVSIRDITGQEVAETQLERLDDDAGWDEEEDYGLSPGQPSASPQAITHNTPTPPDTPASPVAKRQRRSAIADRTRSKAPIAEQGEAAPSGGSTPAVQAAVNAGSSATASAMDGGTSNVVNASISGGSAAGISAGSKNTLMVYKSCMRPNGGGNKRTFTKRVAVHFRNDRAHAWGSVGSEPSLPPPEGRYWSHEGYRYIPCATLGDFCNVSHVEQWLYDSCAMRITGARWKISNLKIAATETVNGVQTRSTLDSRVMVFKPRRPILLQSDQLGDRYHEAAETNYDSHELKKPLFVYTVNECGRYDPFNPGSNNWLRDFFPIHPNNYDCALLGIGDTFGWDNPNISTQWRPIDKEAAHISPFFGGRVGGVLQTAFYQARARADKHANMQQPQAYTLNTTTLQHMPLNDYMKDRNKMWLDINDRIGAPGPNLDVPIFCHTSDDQYANQQDQPKLATFWVDFEVDIERKQWTDFTSGYFPAPMHVNQGIRTRLCDGDDVWAFAQSTYRNSCDLIQDDADRHDAGFCL